MDTDKLMANAEARWAAKGKPEEPAKHPEPEWIVEIQQRVVQARYSGQNVVTNAEVIKLLAEISFLRALA